MVQSFRTAFRGFNRGDVVRYLEYLNNQHRDQINQLRAQLEQQHPQSGGADTLEALRAQIQELQEALAKAQARCAELEEQSQDSALETYRRSQEAERAAREQADLVYYQASGVLAEATARVETASKTVTAAADQVLSQLTQLQVAVSSGKQSLQDAASILNTIKPNRT